VEKECFLCRRDDDGRVARGEGGLSVLECMCGLVLRGMTDPGKPFFTEYGSFRANSTADLLSVTSDGDPGVETRNTCSAMGYESVALVPLRSGDRIIGLIQANSRERGRFDPPAMEFLEKVARHAGPAIEAAWHREELDRLSREFEARRRGVETTVALGEMTATLAHEIKNPLAGMMLSATRLRKALGRLEGHEKLESIAEQLCTAINALSETVTRVGRSVREPKLERTEINVNDVLESAVSLVAPRASEQGVTIVRDMVDELPKIHADAHYLMRAFLNLLVNALDVMPSSGMLHLAAKVSDSGEVEVVIGDTGPGVKPDEVESFFRPFETSKPGGTGLGLGIVRRIVELHSGTVALRPRPGGGTEAVVTLPVTGERTHHAQVNCGEAPSP
jgi:signal transduction histidine kinase